MKMKEFGPGGRASLAPPLDPPMVRDQHVTTQPARHGVADRILKLICVHPAGTSIVSVKNGKIKRF